MTAATQRLVAVGMSGADCSNVEHVTETRKLYSAITATARQLGAAISPTADCSQAEIVTNTANILT